MDKLTEMLGFEASYVLYPAAAVIVAGIAHWIVHRYLQRWARKTQSDLDDQIINQLDRMILPLLFIAILYWLTHWLDIPETVAMWVRRGLSMTAIALVLILASKVGKAFLETLAQRNETRRKFIKPLQMLLQIAMLLTFVAVSLQVLNINFSHQGVRLIRIIGIVIGAFVIYRMINLGVAQMERLVEDEDPNFVTEAEKRARTLASIINNAGLIIVIGVSIMMVLIEIGMDITPIITGFGVVGVAVGFGAQNLVRDIISGFFLILEDQVRIGDVAMINGTGGAVEAIKLRTTILRDLEGVVHIFPNGEIKQVSNRTKGWSFYVVDLGVAYKEDVDSVMTVLKDIGEQMKTDPTFGPLILEPLEILGVDDFGSSQITIKIRIKTLPLKQWQVGRELRRRIKKRFDAEGIEIPFPHLSVYFGEASKPFQWAKEQSPETPASVSSHAD